MASTRRRASRLGREVQGYQAWLEHRGYTPGTVRNMLKELGQVGQPLMDKEVVSAAFNGHVGGGQPAYPLGAVPGRAL